MEGFVVTLQRRAKARRQPEGSPHKGCGQDSSAPAADFDCCSRARMISEAARYGISGSSTAARAATGSCFTSAITGAGSI